MRIPGRFPLFVITTPVKTCSPVCVWGVSNHVVNSSVTPRNGKIKYTIPAIKLPDGTYLMDSRKIADFMEEKHPEPPVYLDSPYLPKVMTLLNELLDPFLDLQLAAIPRCLLSEGSVEYWNTDRQTWVGMPLEQFEKQHDKEAAWKACGPIVQQITALLKENPDGAFFMGKTVSYADFVWGSFLIFARCIGDAELDGLLKVSGDAQAHRALMEGLRPWSERAKH